MLSRPAAGLSRMHLFAHASKPDGESNGLEFAAIPGTGAGALDKTELMRLPVLLWRKNGELVLCDCNTSRTGERSFLLIRRRSRQPDNQHSSIFQTVRTNILEYPPILRTCIFCHFIEGRTEDP